MLDSFTSDTMLKDQVEYLMIKSNIFLSSLYLQFIDTLGSKYMLMMQDTILEWRWLIYRMTIAALHNSQ